MAETRVVSARVPKPLYLGARDALGLPEDTTDTEIIRRAFAALAGLDVRDHSPRVGRPRTRRPALDGDPVT